MEESMRFISDLFHVKAICLWSTANLFCNQHSCYDRNKIQLTVGIAVIRYNSLSAWPLYDTVDGRQSRNTDCWHGHNKIQLTICMAIIRNSWLSAIGMTVIRCSRLLALPWLVTAVTVRPYSHYKPQQITIGQMDALYITVNCSVEVYMIDYFLWINFE